jgi:hypothetical protein
MHGEGNGKINSKEPGRIEAKGYVPVIGEATIGSSIDPT